MSQVLLPKPVFHECRISINFLKIGLSDLFQLRPGINKKAL